MQELLNQLNRLAMLPQQIEGLTNIVTGGIIWNWLWGLLALTAATSAARRAEKARKAAEAAEKSLIEVKALLLALRPYAVAPSGPPASAGH